MLSFKFNKIKKSILILLIYFLLQNFSFAEKIKDFNITGNDRISDETIQLFSTYSIGDDISNSDLNIILKKLYETNFFENIELKFDENIVNIYVTENPLIQSLVFDGIKKQSLIEKIKEILVQKEKSSFVESKLNEDQNRIINTLRVNGYYFSEVSTKIKRNDNNTVDVIYSIELGEKALIKNIKFIGKKVFKDNKLRKVIVSEEHKFWKFISSKKNIDIQRFKLDEKLLKNFYKNKGYYNVKINSSFAQIIEDKYFDVVFNIDAGQKYFFNKMILNIPIDYNKSDFAKLENVLIDLQSKPYSFNKIESILDEIDEIAINNDYQFVSATYNEKIVDNDKIDLSIDIKDSEKFYIDRINITGNNITSERVIRNVIISDEGDPFNELLVNKSYNNIRALNLFKKVITDVETNENNKTKTININVEEKPTGEIFAGAGTGTGGHSLSFGISENNYLGEGIKLGLDVSITDTSLTGEFFSNEKNYKNSNKSLYRSFHRSELDNLTDFGYKTAKTGFSFGTSYEQYKDIFFSPTISNSYEEITTTSAASAAQKKQAGNYLDLNLNYAITLNKLNQNFNPSDGYKFRFSQELPLYSEDYTLINKIDVTKYIETESGNVFSFGFFTATSNSLSNDDARLTKRIFIPTRKLRGFEPGKIGPKDGSDYIGGNYGSSFNIASTMPGLLTEIQEIDISIFFDAANVWGVDYSSSIDENSKIRSSTGIAMDWFTPIGPLSLSYALPLSKTSTDVTENVRFNIGTTF